MSKDIKQEDLIEKKEALTPEAEAELKAQEEADAKAKADEEAKELGEQDPLKEELERVQKTGRTEKEKAEFSLKKNAERVKALGGDVASILDMDTDEPDEEEDDKPLTIGMFKKIQQDSASKTALQQADEIQNETERELVKYHLENTIRPSGNPTEDLKTARALVNAVKNTKIIEESNRKSAAKTHSNASGANAKEAGEAKGELTEDEKLFLGKPFNMTKEAILKTRVKK